MKIATNQERLNELFDADPRSDTAIAADLGVSKQTLSMWRHGTRSPKKSVLIKISQVYHVSIEWLMGFDVDRNGSGSSFPFSINNMSQFGRVMQYMTRDDYEYVIAAFDRAYKEMQRRGVKL